MKCSRLNVKTIIKLCDTINATKYFCCKIYTKLNESKPIFKANNAKYIKRKYGVSYCVRYRPVWLLEWILARGWWNDTGIRTPDGKFKD